MNDPTTGAKLDARAMNAALIKAASLGPAAARAIATQGAELLVGEAQADAPVKTGDLKASHTVIRRDEEAIRRVSLARSPRDVVRALKSGPLAVIGATVRYAAAVHENHPTKARWFVNSVRQNFVRIVTGVAKRAVEQEARR